MMAHNCYHGQKPFDGLYSVIVRFKPAIGAPWINVLPGKIRYAQYFLRTPGRIPKRYCYAGSMFCDQSHDAFKITRNNRLGKFLRSGPRLFYNRLRNTNNIVTDKDSLINTFHLYSPF